MTKVSHSILDLDDEWAGVDAWEDPGILAAAEASGADKVAEKARSKLKSEGVKHDLLAASAKEHLKEMTSLLEKVELSTVSKFEMERLAKLDEKMKHLKVDLTASKSVLKSCNEDMLKSMTKAKTYDLMKTAKAHDIKSVIRAVREAETVDLAFLLDCTSSMGVHIEGVKSSMKDVVRRVTRTNQGLKLRVAVVGYRDLCDVKRFEVLDFTSSVSDFEAFVSTLKASGGGDTPEDMAGAVQKANALSWNQTSRITFIIADAPCHGCQYHTFDDTYPDGTPGVCIEKELKLLSGKGGQAGMQFQFGRITPHCDSMLRVFSSQGVEFETCDLKESGKLSSAVSSSVRKSISKSVTASRSKSTSKLTGGIFDFEEVTSAAYTIREAKPSVEDWKSFRTVPVGVLCNKPIKSVNDFKAPLRFGLVRWGKSKSKEIVCDENKMLMRRSNDPFAEGEMRLAYYGQIGKDETALMSGSSGSGEKVLKSFKKITKSSSDRKRYLEQMEVSTIAQFLAQEFNNTCRPAHCPEIRFLSVYVVEDEENGERFCAEDQLPCAATAFTKYSNNTGYWNEDEINQSLLLFTCFTHEMTGGYMLVTDLQGVRHGNEYILTDPAIICKDSTRFGETNLGTKFLEKCLTATEAMLEEYGWDA